MADRPPIPPPTDADPEDVFWALSTATTLYGRGERAEALKWLRRAAEHASDENADERALELMKAAAELGSTAPEPAAAAPLAARSSPPVPPPLPRKPPTVPPPLPSRPLPVPPVPAPRAAPPIPPAPRAPLPGKPPRAAARERHATLTGRRAAAAKRASSAAPVDFTDIPVDDLDEVTSVLDGKDQPASARVRKAVLIEAPVPSTKPAAAPAKAPLPVKPPSGPASRPSTSWGARPAKPAGDIESPKAPSPAAAPAKAPPKVEAVKAEIVKAAPARPAVTRIADKPPSVVVSAAPSVTRAPAPRKATMQLVDEGFESMLAPEEPPQGVAPALPPESAPVPSSAPVSMSAPPSGLLAQRVAVIPGPDGHARVVLAAGLGSLPEGAVVAVLVPLAPDDGAPLAELLSARKA